MEAKCLIAHDRQSSGELRRTRLQNHNQALSHPKHQRGVGIILNGYVCPNKVFTPVKCTCDSVMLKELFFFFYIQRNRSASFYVADLQPISTCPPPLSRDPSVEPRGRQPPKQEVGKREKVGAPVQVKSVLSCLTNFNLAL